MRVTADLPTVVPHVVGHPVSGGTDFELCKIHLTEFMTCFTHMTRDLYFMWRVEADAGHLPEPELKPQTKRSTMPSALPRKIAVANPYREKIVQQPQRSAIYTEEVACLPESRRTDPMEH